MSETHYKPERIHSEPLYEVRDPARQQYARARTPPNYYGPDFGKGPCQENIFNRRAQGERISTGHPELRGRANSFHRQGIQQPIYSNPYEIRPEKFTPQMKADYEYYKKYSDNTTCIRDTNAAWDARGIQWHKTNPPTFAHARQIEEAISRLPATYAISNKAAQGRDGFAQKYPQAFREEHIRGHGEQAYSRIKQTRNNRNLENELHARKARWDLERKRRGLPLEEPR